MFGNLGELAGMMKKFQDIQKNMKKMKDDLANLEICGKSSCGQIEILLSGDMNVKKVHVNPAFVALNDAELMEKVFSEALTSALTQVKTEAARKLSEATGGLNLPGLNPF